MAAHPLPVADLVPRRRRAAAQIPRVIAALGETAAAEFARQRRHAAADHRQRLAAAVRCRAANRTACANRDARGCAKNCSRDAVSTISPAYMTATRCAISATTARSCVISSIDMPRLALQFAQQIEYLRLDRDVERGGRLVGDQQLGIARERDRDHHALLHAAGQLERIFARGAAPDRGCRPRRAVRSRARRARRPRVRYAAPASRRSARPTVITGFRLSIGSWKIMATRRPRTSRIAISGLRQQVLAGELDRCRRRPARHRATGASPTMRSSTCRSPIRRAARRFRRGRSRATGLDRAHDLVVACRARSTGSRIRSSGALMPAPPWRRRAARAQEPRRRQRTRAHARIERVAHRVGEQVGRQHQRRP